MDSKKTATKPYAYPPPAILDLIKKVPSEEDALY
jgi:hypothetical protein